MVDVRRPKNPVVSKNTKAATGASQSKTTAQDQINSWLGNHRLVAKESINRLLKTPASSTMTWLVIGIALALPTGLYVGLANLQIVSTGWDGAAKISLFLKKSVNDYQGEQLSLRLQQRSEISETRFISREKALAEFQELSGFGEVLEGLESNPLPAVIIVTPDETQQDKTATRVLLESLRAVPEVEKAQLDLEWVKRLYTMMEIGRRMTTALAFLLSLGVLLVVGNTIRLAIENRREEILVVKLVGGTDRFVRRPFLYTGLWYGLGGGLIAWIIIAILLFWLSSPVATLSELYASDYRLQGLGLIDGLGLLFTGAMLGLIGAWFAVNRHIGEIEPR